MNKYTNKAECLIIVRGAGDLATGVIYALWMAGYPVVALETAQPTAIRRAVALSEAVYDGMTSVEGMEGVLTDRSEKALQLAGAGKVPVMIDPSGAAIQSLKPMVVVDAVLAKRNLGTRHDMAPLTIALGPGFTAGSADAGADVDVVVETMRGHNLGRLILSGSALPNTGVPGAIAGHAADRVMHTSAAGVFRCVRSIGDSVEKGDELAFVETKEGERVPVQATLRGILRGILRDGTKVPVHMKAADIDPRPEERQNCFTISDKSRSIGNSVLLAVEAWRSGRLHG